MELLPYGTPKGTLISEWQSQGDSITRAAWTPNDEENCGHRHPATVADLPRRRNANSNSLKMRDGAETRDKNGECSANDNRTKTRTRTVSETVETTEQREVEVELMERSEKPR